MKGIALCTNLKKAIYKSKTSTMNFLLLSEKEATAEVHLICERVELFTQSLGCSI